MKIIEKALFELLKTITDVSNRVYAMRAPQNAASPFIVFQRVDSERWRSIDGPSGMAQALFQIDCYSTGFYECKDIQMQVEELLDGYSGLVYYGSESPRESIKIGGISLQNDIDIIDQTDNPVLFRNIGSFLVTYNQRD
jgi:hypothetical protein